MEWWVWAVLAGLLAAGYVTWLAGRVSRLHRRAESASAALEACLVRRAAAAALLADELQEVAPQPAAAVHAAARLALDATPAAREEAENDLTQMLRSLPERSPGPPPGWESLVTASRRLGLARQVHTDLVRDALAVRRRRLVRLLRLARAHPQPAYFDVGDPVLDEPVWWAQDQARQQPQ